MYINVIILLFVLIKAINCDVLTIPSMKYHVAVPVLESRDNGRIVSGNHAAAEQFPWQVAVEAHGLGVISSCGGSLISSNAVLTAGHCCKGYTTFKILMGGLYAYSHLVTRTVDSSKVVIHPKYDITVLSYDAAIIKLNEDVSFGPTIQPIGLPRFSDAVEDFFFNSKITVSGWGRTESGVSSSQLKYTDMYVIKNALCKLYFGDVITDSILCAEGTQNGVNGPCNGDSGGPAIMYQNNIWVLIGITSFTSNSGCSAPVPAGFTNVAFLLNWISVNTGIPITKFI